MTDVATGAPAEGYAVPEWTIGDRLRKARVEAKLDQKHMATEFAVSPGTISNWETARTVSPRNGFLEVIRRWAEMTCVPVEWLMWGNSGSDTAREESLHPDQPVHHQEAA